MDHHSPSHGGRTITFHEAKQAAAGHWLSLLADLAPDLGPAIDRAGRHVTCPIHGGNDGFRLFRDAARTGGGICNTCGHFADGFALLAWVNDWTLVEALEAVAGRLGMSTGTRQSARPLGRSARRSEPTPDPAAKLARLERWWTEAAEGAPLLRAYFAYRGLSLEPPPTLRLHPALPYWSAGEPRVCLVTAPVLLARVESADGRLAGLHRTYLQPDGRGKLHIEHAGEVLPPKKLYSLAPGATNGAAVRLYPPGLRLALTEGIETALAVREATSLAVWACVSAGGLERVALPEAVRAVIIMADRDGSGTGERAARALARRLVREGRRVKVVLPPAAGYDWLDVLRGEVSL